MDGNLQNVNMRVWSNNPMTLETVHQMRVGRIFFVFSFVLIDEFHWRDIFWSYFWYRQKRKQIGRIIEKKQKQETKKLFIHVIIFQLQYKLWIVRNVTFIVLNQYILLVHCIKYVMNSKVLDFQSSKIIRTVKQTVYFQSKYNRMMLNQMKSY